MGGHRRVLVKLVLFQLDGHGHPQDCAKPNIFPTSRGSILGLSIDVEFVSKFSFKCGSQRAETILNKFSNIINKIHTGLISVLQGFQKYIA